MQDSSTQGEALFPPTGQGRDKCILTAGHTGHVDCKTQSCGKVGAWAVGMSGLLVTMFAMVVAMVPPAGDEEPLLFELKVVGGALSFIAIGGIVYWIAHRRGAVRRMA